MWFKKNNDQVKSVIFVETTPDNELINALKETEEKFESTTMFNTGLCRII